MARIRICAVLSLLIVAAQPAAAEQAPSPPAEGKGGVVWSQSYEVGMKVAAMEQSPVLLFFTASWCTWCRKLEREVLMEPEVTLELRKFICVKLDVDKNHDVAMAYGVVSMPRIIVINTHNEVIGDWLGYRDTKEFLQLLADIRPYVSESVGTRTAPQVNRPVEHSTGGNQALQTSPQEPAQLMDLLGHKELKIRQDAMIALLKSGPAVVPVMLDALEHEYLGVRIAAWKIIRTLNKTELSFDPWGPGPERAEQAKKLREQLKIALPKTSSAEIPGP